VPPETRYAKNGDVNIAYQVVGGLLDLVLVHGWVQSFDAWSEIEPIERFFGACTPSPTSEGRPYDTAGSGFSLTSFLG
jgi:pimeloyl-ACP methyl ester carboxylesterase